EAAFEDAIVDYDNGADWDTFDQLADWSWNSPPGSVGGISLETVNKVQGVGSMGMSLNISSGATWVSALHSGTVNWSAWDHLVVWINATDVNPPLSFNITATVGASPRPTPAIPLTQSWNEVAVTLTGLAKPHTRH